MSWLPVQVKTFSRDKNGHTTGPRLTTGCLGYQSVAKVAGKHVIRSTLSIRLFS